VVRINLALQGGGAHGAFSWGVLDVLLQVPEVEIASVSGTSAGALNGAALKSGMAQGNREAALENLEWLWSKMGALSGGGFGDWLAGFEAETIAQGLEYSPAYVMTDLASRFFSPYSYGPFYNHPLKALIESFHYDKICGEAGPDLFVCATNVRTGKAKIFTGADVSVDAILASACLPTVFQAVEITDRDTGVTDAYWDGGYTGNPALWPLFRKDLPKDIVIVNITPIERGDTPRTPAQIQSRMNEISFNSSLLAELRAIAFVKRMLAEGTLAEGQMKDVHVHMIADDALMNDLSAATKMVPIPSILHRLKKAGQRAAITFLDNNFDKLGKQSSVDLPAIYG
jgi:NTE family protein